MLNARVRSPFYWISLLHIETTVCLTYLPHTHQSGTWAGAGAWAGAGPGADCWLPAGVIPDSSRASWYRPGKRFRSFFIVSDVSPWESNSSTKVWEWKMKTKWHLTWSFKARPPTQLTLRYCIMLTTTTNCVYQWAKGELTSWIFNTTSAWNILVHGCFGVKNSEQHKVFNVERNSVLSLQEVYWRIC